MAPVPDNALEAPFGRGWRLLALWCLEASVALAALWALTHGRTLMTMVAALGFLLLCEVALLVPGHVLRAALKDWPARRRKSALQLLLALSAAAVAAALGTAHGWAAIILILLLGDALWALELELRAQAQAPK